MIIEKVTTNVRIDVYEDKSGSGTFFDGFVRKPLGVVSSTDVNEFNKKIKDAGFIRIIYNNDILVSMATQLMKDRLYNNDDDIQMIYYHPKKKYWLVKRTLKNILENDAFEIRDMLRPAENEV